MRIKKLYVAMFALVVLCCVCRADVIIHALVELGNIGLVRTIQNPPPRSPITVVVPYGYGAPTDTPIPVIATATHEMKPTSLAATPVTAAALKLDVHIVVGNVNVVLHDDVSIKVDPPSGDPADTAVIQIYQNGDTVVVQGKYSTDGIMIVRHTPGSDIWTVNGVDRRLINITIHVPRGTSTSVGTIYGETLVEDIEAPFRGDLSTTGDMQIGRVTKANIDVSGTGSATVASAFDPEFEVSGVGGIHLVEVTGSSLRADISEMGGVLIDSGNVQLVEMNISGGGYATHNGTATDADIDLSGSGTAYVAGVNEGKIKVNISGAGQATVASGSVQQFDADVSGIGSISYSGIAFDGYLQVSGVGSIYVTHVVNVHQEDEILPGQIRIDHRGP